MPSQGARTYHGALLLLLRTQLEVLAAPQVLHLDGRALLALHLKGDLLGNLFQQPSGSESTAF